jgi:hypothetical protein
MSAFVVGHDHIDGLLTFAIERKASYYDHERETRIYFTRDNATEIGRILLQENERSVHHRYPGDNDLPGTIGETSGDYTFRSFAEAYRIRHRDLCLVILKACDCFDYQSCETDDYEQSQAHRIIDDIRGAAIRALPGYDTAAGWELQRRSASLLAKTVK